VRTAEGLQQVTDFDPIFGEGPTLTLGGTTHQVRYGFKALHYLEQRFGSMQHFIDSLEQPTMGPDRLRAICLGLTAGLLHEKPREAALEDFEADIEDALDADISALGGARRWINEMGLAIAAQRKVGD
jgi:hypothetical protein